MRQSKESAGHIPHRAPTTPWEAEAERNFEAFNHQREALVESHPDEYVVLRNGAPAFFRSSREQAERDARRQWPDGLYSIQHCVPQRSIDIM